MSKTRLTIAQKQKAITAAQFIKAILESVKNRTRVLGPMVFSIGDVEQRMKDFALANGVSLASHDVYMSYSRIAHACRNSKKSDGKAVSENQLMQFPLKRFSMDLYYDGRAFVYTDYETKYIINPTYELKFADGKQIKVAFVTASKSAGKREFGLDRYKKI